MSRRDRECGTKDRHPSREVAETGIAGLEQRGAASGLMHAYRCRFCSAWHIGHRRFWRAGRRS